MPQKIDKIGLSTPFLDRRVKLLPCQKERMLYMKNSTGKSYAQLAAFYKVSKRTIMFCCNPESLAKAKEQYKERRKDGRYYKREEHTKSIMSLRAYKKELGFQKLNSH